MALVDIQRVSGGYTEHLAPFEVLIDGEMVGLLGPSGSWTFEVGPGAHEVVVKIYWCQSETVKFLLGEDDRVSFRCETRANLLTDGYWATFGRRRYLRLKKVPSLGGDREVTSTKQDGGEANAFRPRRPGIPLFLMVGAGFLSLALSQNVSFLVAISIIFILVQAVMAINFHILAPGLGPVRGSKTHDPFRFRVGEEVFLCFAFGIAGIAALIGALDGGTLGGWLALAAAGMGALNVLTARP